MKNEDILNGKIFECKIYQIFTKDPIINRITIEIIDKISRGGGRKLNIFIDDFS